MAPYTMKGGEAEMPRLILSCKITNSLFIHGSKSVRMSKIRGRSLGLLG